MTHGRAARAAQRQRYYHEPLRANVARLGGSGALRLPDGTLSALDLQFTTGGAYINGASVSLASVVACSRASTGYAETASGLLTSFAADTLRRTDKGLLGEQAATNVLVRSQEFGTGWAVSTGIAVTGSDVAVAPDGTTTADEITVSASTNGMYQAFAVTAGTTYTVSCYVTLGTLPVAAYKIAIYDATNLAFLFYNVPAQVVSAGVWTRVVYTFTVPAGCTSIRFYPCRTAVSTGTVYLWGAQAETGSVASSYIPTSTTSATRSADVITMTGTNFTDWFNPVAGTFFAEWTTNATSGDNAVLFASDGTNNNRVGHYISSATRIITSRYVSGGSATNPGTIAGAITVGSSNKSATAYAVGASQAITCLNGTLSTAASPAADLTAATTLNIGSAFGLSQINGYLRRLSYFNTRVANALMQGQTT